MKQSKRNQSPSKNIGDEKYLPRIFGIGDLDITYTLKTTKEELENVNIKIEDINTQDDLELIVNEKSLWGNITVSSENYALDTLINITKMAEGEIFAEFTTFAYPEFENKEIENMFDEQKSF